MMRTREEYDNAIAILDDGCHLNAEAPALEAMRELRDSAFALEEALVNLREKAEAALDMWSSTRGAAVPAVMQLALALQVSKIAQAATAPGTAQEGAAAPAPATPLQPHQSEEIMGKGEPEKFTGPSGDLPDAGNSTPGV